MAITTLRSPNIVQMHPLLATSPTTLRLRVRCHRRLVSRMPPLSKLMLLRHLHTPARAPISTVLLSARKAILATELLPMSCMESPIPVLSSNTPISTLRRLIPRTKDLTIPPAFLKVQIPICWKDSTEGCMLPHRVTRHPLLDRARSVLAQPKPLDGLTRNDRRLVCEPKLDTDQISLLPFLSLSVTGSRLSDHGFPSVCAICSRLYTVPQFSLVSLEQRSSLPQGAIGPRFLS